MRKLLRNTSFWALVMIIGVGTILRFSYLNRVPSGISDDELDTVLTARSVFYSGKTLEGAFSPFSFQSVPTDALVPYARAPYMLLSAIAGFFDHGLGETKIPFTLVSVLMTIVLTRISWLLWGKRIGIYTAFVSSLNPWSIYFGRTAFDTPLSVFFIYTFLLCILSFNNWWLLLAFIPWIVGLYSYQGMIVIYPLVLITGIAFAFMLRAPMYKKPYIVLTIAGVLAFFLFMMSFPGDRVGTRMGEIATPNNATIIAQVDNERRKSVQTSINPLFMNKVTTSAWHILRQYINAFSTGHLFVTGEGRSTFSLWSHGLFYSIDIIFLITGLYSAYHMNRKKAWFLGALILIAPIPAAISTTGVSYALRAAFMYPALLIYIAIGISKVWDFMGTRRSFKLGLILLYALVLSNFLHIYFIRNPVANSEAFGFGNRVLSKYMTLASESGVPVLYIGNNVLNTYRQHIFYAKLMTNDSIPAIQHSVRVRNFEIGLTRFIECPTADESIFPTHTVITPFGKVCPALTEYKKHSSFVAIAQLSDSGRIFEIYNDTVCKKYSLLEYQPMISFKDLNVESMSAEKFCNTYISKPKSENNLTVPQG